MLNKIDPTYVFELSRELGLKLDKPGVNVLSENQFTIFKEKYLQWSIARDTQLIKYLNSTPQIFRCFIPRTERYLTTARQVVWYYDEIIVDDPVLSYFDKSSQVVEILETLYLFREAIRAGYIRFAGNTLIPPKPLSPSEIAITLSNDSAIKSKLDETVRFGLETRNNELNMPFYIYEMSLDYGSRLSMTNVIPFDGTLNSIPYPKYRVGEVLKECSAQDLANILQKNPYDIIAEDYPMEVNLTLYNTHIAKSLKATPLFDRELDGLVLQKLGQTDTRQTRDIGSLILALPYIEGVDPEYLQELRSKLPEAFREFRNKMSFIATQANKDNPENFHEHGKLLVERELLPQIRTLDAEIKAISEKKKIIGHGSKITAATACLCGTFLGVDPSFLGSILTASFAANIAVCAEFQQKSVSLESNPFYFIWKVAKKS